MVRWKSWMKTRMNGAMGVLYGYKNEWCDGTADAVVHDEFDEAVTPRRKCHLKLRPLWAR